MAHLCWYRTLIRFRTGFLIYTIDISDTLSLHWPRDKMLFSNWPKLKSNKESNKENRTCYIITKFSTRSRSVLITRLIRAPSRQFTAKQTLRAVRLRPYYLLYHSTILQFILQSNTQKKNKYLS